MGIINQLITTRGTTLYGFLRKYWSTIIPYGSSYTFSGSTSGVWWLWGVLYLLRKYPWIHREYHWLLIDTKLPVKHDNNHGIIRTVNHCWRKCFMCMCVYLCLDMSNQRCLGGVLWTCPATAYPMVVLISRFFRIQQNTLNFNGMTGPIIPTYFFCWTS
jgi:hypothetical protein